MSKPDDVSRHAPQRASPDNSIKLAHVDDGVTSPETRPKLAAQASEHLVHITNWKAYEIGGAERPAGAHACGSRLPTMAASATSVRRRLRLRA